MTEIFAQDAETAVLSLILNNPEKVFDVSSLKVEMFTSSPNQVLWTVIKQVADEQHIPEYNLLLQTLKKDGKLNSAGGIDYLQYLKNSVFRVENFPVYEEQILSNHKTKNLLSLSAKITGEVEAGSQVDAILGLLRNGLEELESVSGETAVVGMETATREAWEQITYRIDHPGLRGHTTGLTSLDNITGGYCGSDVWIFAGRPSMGKSAVMFNSSLALGKNGIPVLLMSKEMNRVSCVERLIALESDVNLSDIRTSAYTQKRIDSVSAAIKSLKGLPILIDDKCWNIDYVITTIRKYVKLHGVKVVFVDYIQMFSEKEENLAAEIGAYSRRLKNLAKELNITIVVLSQLNRDVEKRDDKHPNLSDLKQSGDLEQDADIVIMLYRDEYYYKDKSKHPGEIEFLIRKFRNGPIGVLAFQMNLPTNRISGDGEGKKDGEQEED